jgi:hypothetical protein
LEFVVVGVRVNVVVEEVAGFEASAMPFGVSSIGVRTRVTVVVALGDDATATAAVVALMLRVVGGCRTWFVKVVAVLVDWEEDEFEAVVICVV